MLPEMQERTRKGNRGVKMNREELFAECVKYLHTRHTTTYGWFFWLTGEENIKEAATWLTDQIWNVVGGELDSGSMELKEAADD